MVGDSRNHGCIFQYLKRSEDQHCPGKYNIPEPLYALGVNQQEHPNLFIPPQEPARYFPIFTAMSAMYITLYRSMLCDQNALNKLSDSRKKTYMNAYQAIIDKKVGASMESTYNSWFLRNNRYMFAKDIRIHFELRFAFDYTIAIGAGGQKCDFAMKENVFPKSYSAFPLFYGEALDFLDDRRMTELYGFYSGAMTYSIPLKKLTQLGVVYNTWDDNGNSFRGGFSQYSDGSKHVFGDYVSGSLPGWTLGPSCRVRGMRYEFGKQYENSWHECWGDNSIKRQYYRTKECWNKFKATIDCKGIADTTWQLGHLFHDPNTVIGDRKTRVFDRFVGWKTKNHDYDISNCKYVQTYAVWVAPHGRTPLLDNLLTVYRIDSVDYI
eukprot:Gregarina_sp_Pseudo_9__5818@NODE_885_length_2096_cov_22_381138_g831_i0_p1_GENE_NODE_885_length_2096_cov_22_381138_g831_i0NODE_885_length_2096_cov_22_381138_g831_i0_p1_ORF_typecomplete_len380_score25_25Endotoxin_N/PF03945_14/0_06_NODE_885_length_2096_cov_22_381138_g831_i03631502